MNEFYTNKILREQVRAYIRQIFEREIIDKVFNREDVSHVADANDLVDRAFDQMEIDYGPKKEVKSLNEAR